MYCVRPSSGKMSALDQPQVESSLESFLRRVQPRLKVLFARYRIPLQDTEDILQQALLALVYQGQTVRDPEAWLVGTIRNKCLLYWREQRRKLYDAVDAAVLEFMAEPTAPAQEGADIRRDVATAIERLPERCRALLALRYRQGYEPPELAERLGYSQASISKITTRCLAALTRQLVAGGIYVKKTDG
jgi:RNA polymerase sigma factor (sigma-70 family)